MLGVCLAALSAATFAFNNASARRGVLTGSVLQALAITVPIGVPIFLLAVLATGNLTTLSGFSNDSIALLALAGVLHFVVGRYGNFRAAQAIGNNLSAPVIQLGLVVSLACAILVLKEVLTPLRILGIALLALGPVLMRKAELPEANATALVPRTRSSRTSGGQGERELRVQRGTRFIKLLVALGFRSSHRTVPQAVANFGIGPLDAALPKFVPRYAEGYAFALVAAAVYGATPVLIRLGVVAGDLGSGLVGGLISYAAAALAVALLLLWPGRLRHALAITPQSLKWFTYSGISVCIAQMFVYMAFTVAPVSVVMPVLQLHLALRFWLARVLNPQHELFGSKMLLGTAVSLAGALAISLDSEFFLSVVALPPPVAAVVRWHWP